LEMFNPSGSIKDRTALNMIRVAEDNKLIGSDTTIIEPTSGNTGVALAMVCALKGYRLILVMPESTPPEQRRVMESYGAELILTPNGDGIEGAVEEAKKLHEKIPNSWCPNQFENLANPDVHEFSTGPEIIAQTGGHIDAFVAGIGTGGTITGVARALAKTVKNVRVIGVEPAECAVLSGSSAGKHGIQGIGVGFVPKILDRDLINEIVTVETEEAVEYTRRLPKEEGIFAGVSSGAALAVAVKTASLLGPGKRVVTIFADGGNLYETK